MHVIDSGSMLSFWATEKLFDTVVGFRGIKKLLSGLVDGDWHVPR
jgi:hypothetical protein